jgi:hypothetical protein
MEIERIQLQKAWRRTDPQKACLSLWSRIETCPSKSGACITYLPRESDVHRGKHAHRHLNQLAVAVRGSVTFLLDDGSGPVEVVLTIHRKVCCSAAWCGVSCTTSAMTAC